MASPQIKNGYTKIANELLDAYSRIRLSGEENQVFWTIIRKTYGYNKKDDTISLSQFCISTGMMKPNICRTLSKLIKKNMIIKTDKDNNVKYRIQKDYSKWLPLSKLISVIKTDKKSVIKTDTHKRNKEKRKKYIKNTFKKYLELANLLEQKIKENLPRHKFQGRQYKESWANTFRIMIEKKEATKDEIKRLINWIFDKSDFWSKNILSADKLRKKFGRLWVDAGFQKEEDEIRRLEKEYEKSLGEDVYKQVKEK